MEVGLRRMNRSQTASMSLEVASFSVLRLDTRAVRRLVCGTPRRNREPCPMASGNLDIRLRAPGEIGLCLGQRVELLILGALF